MILFIDNYDSFVYNLVQYFGRISDNIRVFRNDRIEISDVLKLEPDGIVISPGPGRPENAGKSVEIVKKFYDKIPILGVCLGHQAVAYASGAKITHAKKILHGKTSLITHKGGALFEGVSNPFSAGRYHSLIVEKAVPAFDVTGRTKDGEIMALKLKKHPVFGVQFHPESILTEEGFKIVENFCRIIKC